jgi:hypothetical protein
MQPTEDFLVPVPNSQVFSVAILYPVSLTPRFSELYSRVCYHNRFSGLLFDSQKTAEAVWARSRVVNTQLKQGVNEKSVDAKPYPKLSFRLEALRGCASLRACRADEHPG